MGKDGDAVGEGFFGCATCTWLRSFQTFFFMPRSTVKLAALVDPLRMTSSLGVDCRAVVPCEELGRGRRVCSLRSRARSGFITGHCGRRPPCDGRSFQRWK